MINLRPHHLLCTQGYSGNGYSDEFVNNMSSIVKMLKDTTTEINITFGCDNICSSCPNLLPENICCTDIKVKEMDSKVVKFFNIEEGVYNYCELIKNINSKITLDIMNDICGECNWYPISNCRKNILK